VLNVVKAGDQMENGKKRWRRYSRHVSSWSDCKRYFPLEEAVSLVPVDFGIELDQTDSVGLE